MGVSAPSKQDVDSTLSPRAFGELLDSEASVLQLLLAIRGSRLSAKEKLALRDLVLEHSSESDKVKKKELKNQICEQLSQHSSQFLSLVGRRLRPTANEAADIKPVAKPSTPVVESRLGRARPSPLFKSTSSSVGQSPTPPADNMPVAKTEIKSEPKKPPEVSKTPPVPKEATPVVADTQPEPQPANQPAPATNADMQKRINEIKHSVNGKVGNPVNLISRDKAVGQEYMSSLLAAMKAASSGLATESDLAMARLEKAYQAVNHLLSKAGTDVKATSRVEPKEVTKQPKPPVSPSPVEPVAKEVVKSPPVTPPKKLKLKPVPPAAEPETVSKPKQAPAPAASERQGLYQRPADDVLQKEVKEDRAVELTKRPAPVTPATPPKPPANKDVSKEPKRSLIGSLTRGLLFGGKSKQAPAAPVKPPAETKPGQAPTAKTTLTKTSAAATPKPSAKPPVGRPAEALKPVSNVTTLPERMTELEATLSKRKAESKKPVAALDSPEVTKGLEQLLSEWKLFRSSGFLGTGPSGNEHPLYKQLAGLPMAAIVSGRFEGVTPEIKQSITDYLNGWRYEQGIVHEMGETFEHYLRRVIKHILDAQRAKQATNAKPNEAS